MSAPIALVAMESKWATLGYLAIVLVPVMAYMTWTKNKQLPEGRRWGDKTFVQKVFGTKEQLVSTLVMIVLAVLGWLFYFYVAP